METGVNERFIGDYVNLIPFKLAGNEGREKKRNHHILGGFLVYV